MSLQSDLRTFRESLGSIGTEPLAFLNAASPGVIAVFLPNRHYASEEAYLEALASIMREEYEAICEAGFFLQIDCPDLAMARPIWYKELSDQQFVKRAEMNIDVLNAALENVPADRLRMHLCWGNYEGPHDCDIDVARKDHRRRRAGKTAGNLLRGSEPSARTRAAQLE